MKKDKTISDKKLNIEEIKDVVQDCNINFLIGAGLSVPYLSLLGQVEKFLTELSGKKSKREITEDQEKVIKVFLYKKFFDDVIEKNINILSWSEKSDDKELKSTLNNYQQFLKSVNTIMLNRRSTILSKQVNIFTTNFDIFMEKALEITKLEYNDGFSGRFNPVFNLGNFKKSFFSRTLHYDNTYELPVFNLMKIHGSLTWKKKLNKNDICFHKNLKLIRELKEIEIPNKELIDIQAFKQKIKKSENHQINIEYLIECSKDKIPSEDVDVFINKYEKLAIINPTKEKFKETVLNRNYYELLRVYSTELEKENTVLFVMGFSFSDDHIGEVTVRVANSNPTLKIYIFAHTEKAEHNIKNKIPKADIKNDNIFIISPKGLQSHESDTNMKFDLATLNEKIFKPLLRKGNE